jgi:NADH-quinone oxidoreductase subunit A
VLDQYIGVLFTFGLAAVIVGLMVSASALLGARRRRSPMKDDVFECGNPSSGTARGRFSVHFYLVAILFIVTELAREERHRRCGLRRRSRAPRRSRS